MQGNLWKISCSLPIFSNKNQKVPINWLLRIQNYQMTCKYLTSNTTFSKKVNPMEYRIQVYILARTWNLLFMLTMKSILNVKKTSNLIKIISSYNICSKIKSKQAKTFDFFFRIPLFHLVKHSISYVLLIDKPNESFKTQKDLK